jgi:hypothetical protein
MDHNPQGQGHGRRHFHRGRRGPDRRGPDRRAAQTSHAQDSTSRSDVDVEQIMRDIRARIPPRPGVELTNQQIQDLAARRLESILDPRGLNPALLDELRRATGTPIAATPRAAEPPYVFEEQTLYESHNAVTRFFRRLLHPILKLFFNPTPIGRALTIQARLNTEAATREAERDRQQAEWNALHYEILRKLVLEVSRVSLDAQALSLKVDSLAAKVDFNERRVRGIEGAMQQTRPAPRREAAESAPVAAVAAPEAGAPEMSGGAQPPAASEGTRRRRRRRRGRRGSGAAGEATAAAAEGVALNADADTAEGDQDEGPDDEEVTGGAGEEDSVAVAEALAASEPTPAPAVTPPVASPTPPPDGPERHDEEPPER